jgi:Ca2+-binding RTX toxin-like protein
VLALAPAAQAATVSVEGDVVRVVAASGEANVMTLAAGLTDASAVVSDAGAPLVAGPGCAPGADGRVSCSAAVDSGHLAGIDVDAGDFDDSVSVSASMPATLVGGEGDDRITGGDGDDTLLGGGGVDFADGGRAMCATGSRTAPGAAAASTACAPRRSTRSTSGARASITDRPAGWAG